MTEAVTQTFIPGPRLIDGSDLNNMVDQINSALGVDALNPVITALTTVGAGTITAAGIVGGVTSRGGAQAGAAFTDTTATAALIVAALPASVANGTSFFWEYKNTTNAQATLAGGSGVTLSGNVIIPKLTTARYLVTKTSSTAVAIAFVSFGFEITLPATATTSFTNTTAATLSPTGLTNAQLASLFVAGGSLKDLVVPTAADLVAAMPNAAAGASNQVQIRNASSVTLTLTGLTGTTVSGLTLVQPSTATNAVLTIDSVGSATLTGLTSTSLAV